MSLLGAVRRSLVQAKHLAEDVRQLCLTASARAVAQGSPRLHDLAQLSHIGKHRLGPHLWHFVDGRIEILQQRLDELNRSLAEKAVPDERRDRVRQLSHAPGDRDQQNLRLVGTAGDASTTGPHKPGGTPRKNGPGANRRSKSNGASKKI